MFDSRKIRGYLAAMADRGFSAKQVLHKTRLRESDLQGEDFAIDLAQSQIVVSNMLSLTGNAALGLELGREITVADMGVVGYGMLTSATIRDAINLWTDYAPSLYGTMVNLHVHEGKGLWHMELTENFSPGLFYQFCMEEFLMLSHYLGEYLTGEPTHLTRIKLVYPKPDHANQYRHLLNCPVEFSSPVNRITIKSPALDVRLQRNDQYLNTIYQQYCEQNIDRTIGGVLSARVRNYLLKNPGQTPNFTRIASEIGCSDSTLRRRLGEEGVSFRELLQDYRCNMAREYIRSTNLSTTDIAYLLGYKDTKPFLRAFKDWTGMTTGAYKKELGLISRR